MTTISNHSYQPGSLLALPQPTLPRTTDFTNRPTSRDNQVLSDTGKALARMGDTLGQRVDQLGDSATQMAQSFLGEAAKQWFGDAAAGMQVAFDSVQVSAASRFSAAWQQTSDASGASETAAFKLEDAASFTGHGFMTTADGKRFEFEVEVRYQSVLQAASSQNSNAAANNTAEQPASTTSPSASALPLAAQFAGTAADLLEKLTHQDVRLPFSWHGKQQDGKDGLLGFGDLALRLLNLPGGTRQIDLRDPATSTPRPRIDTQA